MPVAGAGVGVAARPDGRSAMRARLRGPARSWCLVVAAAVAAGVRGGFTDLFVYQYGGRALLDGLPVYGSRDPVMGLPFTYPPFAAVVLVPLALLPDWLAAAVSTGASVGALAAVVTVVRRELGRPARGGWWRCWPAARSSWSRSGRTSRSGRSTCC